MKFRGPSSNPRVKSSNPRVTSSNPRITGSNPRITSSNPRVTSSNPRVTNSIPRITKSIKTQVNSLKSSSFPTSLSLKLFGNSWGNSYGQLLVITSCFTFPLLRGCINFERRNLNSPQNSHPPPDDFGEIFTTN